MTHVRVRHVSVAAIAVAALAVSAGPAGAHPADCHTALTASPTAGWPADWAEDENCANAPAVPAFDTSALLGAGASSPLASTMAPAGGPQQKPGDLKQVGHDPLMGRGMNAAIAVHEDYAYIGSRTDGGHAGQPQGGLMVVDISRPSKPRALGPPLDAMPGESTRELRVWGSQDILMVLNTNCGVGPGLHHCTQPSISNLRFYDISGANATDPQLLHQFDVDTHEFYLWEDPRDPERALIFAGNASSTCGTRGAAPPCPSSAGAISSGPEAQPPVTRFSGRHG